MTNRAGTLVGNLSGEMAYESFRPAPLPPNPPIEVSGELLTKLIDANKKIATLEGLSSRIPNMGLFVSMYVRKEALLSSQIEGTQCTLEDILNPLIEENTNRDVSDVVNYIRATEFALERLKTLPLCNRLIKETHAVLLESVRGQEKNPGEFRYSQNWIGGQGSTLKNARYIPPNPEDMLTAMSDLENLSTPALYISYYLKMNRIEYYDRMTQVRRTGDYEQWISFFLQAFADSAEDAIHTIDRLTALHDKSTKLFDSLTKRQRTSVLKVFSYLESNPIIDIQKTATTLEMSYNTVSKVVSILIEDGILKQTDKSGKAKIYSYTEYLDILRKDT